MNGRLMGPKCESPRQGRAAFVQSAAMFRRLRDYAFSHPWPWAAAWGILVAVLLIVVTSTPLWEASFFGLAFLVAVGLVRSRQGRSRN